MWNDKDIPTLLQSTRFHYRFLKVRHYALIFFQILGLLFLLTICMFLFGDPTGHSSDEIGPAAPLIGKLFYVALAAGWNVIVFLMRLHSSKVLLQIKDRMVSEESDASTKDPEADCFCNLDLCQAHRSKSQRAE